LEVLGGVLFLGSSVLGFCSGVLFWGSVLGFCSVEFCRTRPVLFWEVLPLVLYLVLSGMCPRGESRQSHASRTDDGQSQTRELVAPFHSRVVPVPCLSRGKPFRKAHSAAALEAMRQTSPSGTPSGGRDGVVSTGHRSSAASTGDGPPTREGE
jgi:hypothetical protein